MKKWIYAVMSLTLSILLLSCTADRRPTRATAPATVAAATAGAAGKLETFNLVGTEWQLEDLAGSGVVEGGRPTLAFPAADKVSGNGSCNQFSGPLQIKGNEIRLGPLGSTRMACPEPSMTQETKYLAGLQAAERYEWNNPYLLIYCKDLEKPMRFARLATPAKPPR